MPLFPFFKFFKLKLQNLQKKREHRYLVKLLYKKNDAMLRDIGLSPTDIKEREQICCLKK